MLNFLVMHQVISEIRRGGGGGGGGDQASSQAYRCTGVPQ